MLVPLAADEDEGAGIGEDRLEPAVPCGRAYAGSALRGQGWEGAGGAPSSSKATWST
jgi:hypothetical protein